MKGKVVTKPDSPPVVLDTDQRLALAVSSTHLLSTTHETLCSNYPGHHGEPWNVHHAEVEAWYTLANDLSMYWIIPLLLHEIRPLANAVSEYSNGTG